MTLGGNLNAPAPTFVGAFDAAGRSDPQNAKAWTETSLGVFDSQGTKRDVKVQFWKTGPNTWDWQLDPMVSAATVDVVVSKDGFQLPTDAKSGLPDDYEIDPANVMVSSPSGTPYTLDTDYTIDKDGLITFKSSIPENSQVKVSYHMSPKDPDAGTNSGTIQFDAAGTIIPPTDQPAIDFAVPGALPVKVKLQVGSGVNGLTQFATSSTAVLRDQNGYTAGQLQNFSIDRTGLVTGFFTNGTTTPLGQIVLARLQQPVGPPAHRRQHVPGVGQLRRRGARLRARGQPVADDVGRARDVERRPGAGVHEHDHRPARLPGELKVVTTSDEMLQELMQLKR